MQSTPEYWFCTRCKQAWLEPAACVHGTKQHKATCDTDYYLWWRYRLSKKSDDVRKAIMYAAQGLRHSDWPRVVAVLEARAKANGYLFSVAEHPEKSSLADD